jgi:hypothetical protein
MKVERSNPLLEGPRALCKTYLYILSEKETGDTLSTGQPYRNLGTIYNRYIRQFPNQRPLSDKDLIIYRKLIPLLIM